MQRAGQRSQFLTIVADYGEFDITRRIHTGNERHPGITP
jgi:hypothetical protein